MLSYLGKTEIPVALEHVGHVRQLRMRRPDDVENKDVFLTWLFFRRTQENHISVTLELGFHTDFFFALYKDNVLEWSSLAQYGLQMDSDIACYLTTHCESLDNNPYVNKDYRTYPDDEDARTPHVVTSGELAGRLANGVFSTVWSVWNPVFGERPDPLDGALKTTQQILGMLSGAHEDFPRVNLVVSQNTGEREYRRLQGGETFEDGTVVKLDATHLMEVPKQHELVKAWLNLKR
jgi:hypothetical protein